MTTALITIHFFFFTTRRTSHALVLETPFTITAWMNDMPACQLILLPDMKAI